MAATSKKLDADSAAEVSENIDRLTGLLHYLKGAFDASYGVKHVHATPVAGN